MDKLPLVGQIVSQLKGSARLSHHASRDAESEARHGATGSEKRQDARVALEYSKLAKAHALREQGTRAQLDALESFRPGPRRANQGIGIGAIVEIEDEDNGVGRTFFLAPAGAGMNLTGPDGDGLITVVTPASPIGRAVLGRQVGEVIDVTIKGDVREWTITYVC